MHNIRPLPASKGVGFFSHDLIPEYQNAGYRVEQSGPVWNYYFTKENYSWPFDPVEKWFEGRKSPLVTDGFAPNLNKDLHVGHLRNLAVGNAIVKMTRGEAVAMLGASLGVKTGAEDKFDALCSWLGYKPKKYYDVLLPTDVLEHRLDLPEPGELGTLAGEIDHEIRTGRMKLAKVWDGPHGKVIVVTSDGRKLYSYHDLVFAQIVGPDYYVTGGEQAEHFKSLGLGDKHLPMGLILGDDGTKMKSRTGTAFSLEDAIQATLDALGKEGGERRAAPSRELAWNVLCWHMLSVARSQNVKWNVDHWCRPESPGMYVSYTAARIHSAVMSIDMDQMDGDLSLDSLRTMAVHYHTGCRKEMTDSDLILAGWCEYAKFYHAESLKKMDPAQIAHYLHDLARVLGRAYHAEKIVGGRLPFVVFVTRALLHLQAGMRGIGMFVTTKV